MILPTQSGPFDLDADLLAGLQQRYPALDVHAELLGMKLWLTKNPAKLPKRPLRFIENWLKRCKLRPLTLKAVNKEISEREIDQLGACLGIPAQPGEGYPAYHRRLRQAQEAA